MNEYCPKGYYPDSHNYPHPHPNNRYICNKIPQKPKENRYGIYILTDSYDSERTGIYIRKYWRYELKDKKVNDLLNKLKNERKNFDKFPLDLKNKLWKIVSEAEKQIYSLIEQDKDEDSIITIFNNAMAKLDFDVYIAIYQINDYFSKTPIYKNQSFNSSNEANQWLQKAFETQKIMQNPIVYARIDHFNYIQGLINRIIIKGD